MKRIFLTLTFLITFSAFALAQTEKEDTAIAEAIFGKAKKTIIAEYLQIDENQKTEFWNLYDKYEDKSNAIWIERLGLIKQFVESYNTLEDATASRLAEGLMKNTVKLDQLHQEYFSKFQKVIGGLKAATLYQIEIYIQTAVQSNVQSNIPVIGEIQKLQH
ncbi:MAG TPA: hypothetical protein VK796_07555 [Cytophaga sp.]|nr:hypothetical protein [Cytophaga sp.]